MSGNNTALLLPFFHRWPDVLSNLLAAADWGSPFAPQFH
jgi:hypothetical protein